MKNSGIPISSFSKRVQDQISAQLHAKPMKAARAPETPPRPSGKTEMALAAMGLPAPQAEFKFSPDRRWRFDYAWPDQLVALEVEGGVWSGGRHTSGAGFMADMEKYNAATLLGWRVVRCTPETLLTVATTEMIAKLLALNEQEPRSIEP